MPCAPVPRGRNAHGGSSPGDLVPAGRDNRRTRPLGYAQWRPRPDTEALLAEIADVLDRYDAHSPLTVRQLFYALVGAGKLDKSERAYERLGEHLNRARRSGRVPFEALRDDGASSMTSPAYGGLADFHDEIAQRARRYRRDRQAGQPVRIELWSEAAGMMPQLHRVAVAYSVPVLSCGGFSSLTAVRAVSQRAAQRDVPTVLLHVGDFDPSGEAIYGRLARDARAFVLDDRTLAVQDLKAVRVALTSEQVVEHQLPTSPPKTSDSRSRSWQGGTFQLEALPPDVLAELVERAIRANLDLDRLAAVRETEHQERAELLALPKGGPR